MCKGHKGRAARDEALKRVEDNAPASWLEDAKKCVIALSRIRVSFTADDVWAVIGQPPEPRALGAVMKDMSRLGFIEATGEYRQSVRPRCHARPIAVWAPTNVVPAVSKSKARRWLAELRARYESEAA